jgi:23S rRNA (pseudouridine1915-N3)-methyltransferase
VKLNLLCVGRLTESYLRDGCDEFTKRLKHYLPLSIEEQKEHKTGKKQDREKSIRVEGEKLLSRIPADTFLVALDERGKGLSSPQFADLLNNQMIRGTSSVTLIIGGPFGISEEIRRKADLVLSLSPMTLTHQMARLLLLEQLYRSCTIIRNEPYHH